MPKSWTGETAEGFAKDCYCICLILYDTYLACMRFKVLMAVKILIFCFVTPSGLVSRYPCFQGTYCFHLQGGSGLNISNLDASFFLDFMRNVMISFWVI
jgi:hypothetical protein